MLEEITAFFFYPEDGKNSVLQNVDTHLLNYNVSHARQHDLKV
jgi:hypothetical protein